MTVVRQDALRELSSLCAQLRDAERELEQMEKALKEKEAFIRQLVEEDVPSLMSELGVQKLQLETGEQVSVGLEVYASIPNASKEEAFKWLEDNGHGGIIKTEVSVTLGRGELNNAQRLALELTERGLETSLARGVHAGTLKSFIKERLAAGTSVPLELFGARPVNTAKIK